MAARGHSLRAKNATEEDEEEDTTSRLPEEEDEHGPLMNLLDLQLLPPLEFMSPTQKHMLRTLLPNPGTPSNRQSQSRPNQNVKATSRSRSSRYAPASETVTGSLGPGN